MPVMFDRETGTPESIDSTAKVLVYGEYKTRKTTWALSAASLGFNVTILDGDNSHHIIAKLPDEWKKRIGVVNLVDTPDKATFHNFISRIYQMRPWALREHDRESIYAGSRDSYTAKGNHNHVYFDPAKLNSNDVLIVDSWSALCYSMAKHYKIINSKGSKDLNTLPSGNKDDSDIGRKAWEDYGWGKALSLDILGMLRGLPCHVVIVAHAHEYKVMEKYIDDSGREKERVKSSTTQPFGYSGPQGNLLGSFVSDILHMRVNKMDKIEISTRPTFDVKAGSRILDPSVYAFDELSWAKYFELGKAVYTLPERTEYYNSEAFEFLGTEGESRFPKHLRKASLDAPVKSESQPSVNRLDNVIKDKS